MEIEVELMNKKNFKLHELEAENRKLNKNIYELEKDLMKIDQYQRRNNAEFVGIPD